MLMKWSRWKACILFLLVISTYTMLTNIVYLRSGRGRSVIRDGEVGNKLKSNANVLVENNSINDVAVSQPSGSHSQLLHGSACQVIHIGMKASNSEQARDLVELLKQQLYFDYHSAFHLHISASASVVHSFTTLLATWELDRVAVSFYPNAEPRLYNAIPVILRNLPHSVHDILFIDSKMRFTRSISELWSTRDKVFTEERFVAYVQARRDKAKRDCVVCVHDVLLMNVDKARQLFPNLSSPAEDTDGSKSILMKLEPGHVFQLPFPWYVELDAAFNFMTVTSPEDLAAYRLGNIAGGFIDNVYVEEARELNEEINKMSGDVFGHVHHPCPAPGGQKVAAMSPVKEPCKEFRLDRQLSRRVHLYFAGSVPASSGPYDVSMLTQFTLDRLEALEQLVSRWKGPVHALMYADDRDAQKLLKRIAESMILKIRKNLAFHVVYKRRMYYPINFLRNVLVNVSTTPYLLFDDVDLIPSAGMYDSLQKHIEQYMANNNTLTLVVPAFEMPEPGSVPKNRTQLLHALEKGTVKGYRMDQKWNLGHKATNYPKWRTAKFPYVVPYSGAFEPYVVLRSQTAPLYDERMLERMGDKIAYGLELVARGYKFLVLDDCFITHIPHPLSEGTKVWRTSSSYSRCGGILHKEYKQDVQAQHPDVKIK